MSFVLLRKNFSRLGLMVLVAATSWGCTQAAPRQIKLLPANDSASAGSDVTEQKVEKLSTPVDILWVIDNSDSMEPSQERLKKGLSQFAKKYLLSSDTDIQVAIITTDTFVANEAWSKYLVTPELYSKKTPADFGKADGLNFGPDYAKLTKSKLLRTKGASSSLISRFQSLVSVGTKGIYEEHGFDSVQEFIDDNEKGDSPNKLFRKGSQRVIIFLSDEDDQSLGANVGAEPRKLLYHGSYYSGKDPKQADKILPAQFTINCPAETVDGVAIAPMTLCMRDGLVEPVASFKASLDSFFRGLDGNPNGDPKYFVTGIVGKDLATIETLRKNTKERNPESKEIVITQERGSRYLDLVAEVGNGSFAMDIGAEDYSPILNKIGLEIEKRSVVTKYLPSTKFDLARAPDPSEEIVITLVHEDGSTLVLDSSQFTVVKNHVTITDEKLISTLKPGDRIQVQYQPGTVLPASTS